MTSSLPEHPSLEWLRKAAKDRVRAMRALDPGAKLAHAQLALAREHGFASWVKLKQVVEGGQDANRGRGDLDRFLELVGAGRTDEVRTLLDSDPALLNGVGAHPFWGGRPQPLHVAIETGRQPMIALLLERGADVNGNNAEYDDWSPLMLATDRDRDTIRQELLRRGARVGLAEALMMGDDDAVSTLLAGGLPDRVPNRGSWLAFARTVPAIDALIARGARPDQPDRWGTRPVEALSKLGDAGKPLVRHLMSLGLSATTADFARMGDLAELKRMEQKDRAVTAADAVFMAAVSNRHVEIARWLLEHGASPNARASDQSRQSALHSAAWNGDLSMVRLLVESGADLQMVDDEYNASPLGWAETAIEVTGNEGCREVASYLRTQQAGRGRMR